MAGLVFGSRVVLLFSLISETATALAAILVPSALASLLFGGDADVLTQQALRFAGLILLALVAAVWPRQSGAAPQPTAALLLYNVLCAVLLAYVALAHGLQGLLLWPAVLVHAAISVAQYLTRYPSAGIASSKPGAQAP